jgi:parallel beta-helix repeat protein
MTGFLRSLGILCVVCAIISGGTADAATYYVSKSGSDRNSCPSARSESSSKLSINGALPCLVAGDTLYVRAGVYDEYIPKTTPSGTSWSNTVRIAAYPGETVWLAPASAWYVVDMTLTQHYIEFDGINMDGGSAYEGIVRVSEEDAHHIRVKNAELRGNPNYHTIAVMLANGGGNEFINVRLHRVTGSDASHGFYIASSDNLIDNCEIYDVPGAGVHIYTGDGLATDRNTIRNSVIHDISSSGGPRAWGVIIANGSDNAVYNNVIYGIGPGGYGNAGINVYAGSGAKIYNNTVYGSAGSGIYVNSGHQTRVMNNILFGNAWGDFVDYGSETNASNNLTSDPRFVNAAARDFSLRSDSPAINRGVYLYEVPTDRLGAPRPTGSAFDVGAYEFGGQPTAPQPPQTPTTPEPPAQPAQPPSSGSGGSSGGVVDASGGVWTLGANLEILRNGVQVSGGYGSKIVWNLNSIYVIGDDNNWWRWTGETWDFAGATLPS